MYTFFVTDGPGESDNPTSSIQILTPSKRLTFKSPNAVPIFKSLFARKPQSRCMKSNFPKAKTDNSYKITAGSKTEYYFF